MILCHLFWGFGFTTTTTNCHEFVPKIDFVQKVNKKRFPAKNVENPFKYCKGFAPCQLRASQTLRQTLKSNMRDAKMFKVSEQREQEHNHILVGSSEACCC